MLCLENTIVIFLTLFISVTHRVFNFSLHSPHALRDDLTFLHFQYVIILGKTAPFKSLEVNITMKNIKSFQCPNNKDGIGMLVLIQSSAVHMAYGNCKPFCDGIQPCDILTHTRPRDMARSRPPFWIFSFAAWKWVNMDGNWRNFDGNISSYV